mmetsp:Transcript_2384/g.3647  ORF Transcript_2384/g.3647 Transcript_2384/m.3647 type:complete len:190 (-) Transcript_2384:2208-2777(-)
MAISLHSLTYLDISGNHLTAKFLTEFLERIQKRNNLKWLSIAYNSGFDCEMDDPIIFEQKLHGQRQRTETRINMKGNVVTSVKKPIDVRKLGFTETLAKFLHFSDSLLHIDLSGLGLSPNSLKFILLKGLRMSRSLLSCHFSGINIHMDLDQATLDRLLKMRPTPESQGGIVDLEGLATLDQMQAKLTF